MPMRRIALGLRDETYEQIDAARGKIPREKYIRTLITTVLEDSKQAASIAWLAGLPKAPPMSEDEELQMELAADMPQTIPTLNTYDDHDHVWVGSIGNTHCKLCGRTTS